MKKTCRIEVDCASCANRMEDTVRRTAGVQSAAVNFMTQKMILEFDEGQEPPLYQLSDGYPPGLLALGAVGIANMYLVIFADVGIMVLAVLNAVRCLFVKKREDRQYEND